jgi:hypothetical protein
MVARIGGSRGGENETGTDTPELHPSRERGLGIDDLHRMYRDLLREGRRGSDDRVQLDLFDEEEIEEILEAPLRPFGAGCAGADSPREGEIHVGDVEAAFRIRWNSDGLRCFELGGVATSGS